MTTAFFAAACLIVLNCFLGGWELIFNGSLVDWMNLCYICIAGMVLAICDTPFYPNFKFREDVKLFVCKYINILTRVTGKGATFIFLGSALLSAMWANESGGFVKFCAVIGNIFVIGLGGVTVVVGVMKSQKLLKAKTLLYNNNFETVYDQVMRKATGGQAPPPGAGMTSVQFKDMCQEYGGQVFEEMDIKGIWQALSTQTAWRPRNQQNNQGSNDMIKFSKEDLQAWVYDKGFTLL